MFTYTYTHIMYLTSTSVFLQLSLCTEDHKVTTVALNPAQLQLRVFTVVLTFLFATSFCSSKKLDSLPQGTCLGDQVLLNITKLSLPSLLLTAHPHPFVCTLDLSQSEISHARLPTHPHIWIPPYDTVPFIYRCVPCSDLISGFWVGLLWMERRKERRKEKKKKRRRDKLIIMNLWICMHFKICIHQTYALGISFKFKVEYLYFKIRTIKYFNGKH